MLTRWVGGLADTLFLRISGGDSIRADELRARSTRKLLTFVLLAFVPLVLTVGWLATKALKPTDFQAERDVERTVGGYAFDCIDRYLKDPSDSASVKSCFSSQMPPTPLPIGGRALTVSSVTPARSVGGFQTWSVIVDAEIPEAAGSSTNVTIRLGADVSVDTNGLMRMVMLPRPRPERAEGQPVEVATDTEVTEDRPLYNTAKGFISALFVGQGDCRCEPGDPTPWAAASGNFKPAAKPLFATMAITAMSANSEDAVGQNVPPKASGVEVTVRTVMETPSGVHLPMDFPLVMSVVGGRWQVDAINDSPAITPPDSTFSSVTTAPSTTATTSPRSSTASPSPTHPSTTPEGN